MFFSFYTPFGFVNWFELVIVDKYCLHTDKLMLGYGSNVSYLLELIFICEPNPTYELLKFDKSQLLRSPTIYGFLKHLLSAPTRLVDASFLTIRLLRKISKTRSKCCVKKIGYYSSLSNIINFAMLS